jgi:hypothetical protein
MPQSTTGTIALRQFGRADAKISILGFGGHHLGEAPDAKPPSRSFIRPSMVESPSSTTAGNIAAAKPKSGWVPASKAAATKFSS